MFLYILIENKKFFLQILHSKNLIERRGTETDFVKIVTEERKGVIYVGPDFIVKPHIKDLMIRGHSFYAVWDENNKKWSTDESQISPMVDELIRAEVQAKSQEGYPCRGLYLSNFKSNSWNLWRKYSTSLPDSFHKLNNKIIFSNDEIRKEDYATFKLPYSLTEGNLDNYIALTSILYSPEELQKIEWAVGSIITGASKELQKFIVLYGDAGTGKSTILNIIQWLFQYKEGNKVIGSYWAPFNSRDLVEKGNSFALEQFKNDPLIAIQHDGDLSRIEDNTLLNSLVSHETMTVNEKFKSKYKARFETFLFMASNSPVKITNTKSGILRRLIDVYPTGDRVDTKLYNRYMKGIKSELGAIAYRCKTVFEKLGSNYYDGYRPRDMFEETNDFYNFMYEMADAFKDGVSLKTAWLAYKDYVEEAKIQYPFSKRVFKSELKGYFKTYREQFRIDGNNICNYYSDLILDKFGKGNTKVILDKKDEKLPSWLELKEQESIFDQECSECQAQLATDDGKPRKRWDDVGTKLKDINTKMLHYVRIPSNHIVIDFDLVDNDGNKDLSKNLKAAFDYGFHETYAETSQSGNGLHLHYIYDGDVSILSRVFLPGIEVKVYSGLSSLRRKLTVCNNLKIAHISGGLPLKEAKKMLDDFRLENDKKLYSMVVKNLKKGYHASTKCSMDYIKFLTDKAYEEGFSYDIRGLESAIISFAAQSTNNATYCLKLVDELKLCSKDVEKQINEGFEDHGEKPDALIKGSLDDILSKLVVFDVEVYQNVFIVCWNRWFEDEVVRWIQPTREQIETLCEERLVGYNNLKYDNYILLAKLIGYSNMELYCLSKKIINGDKHIGLSDARNLSFADVYDFCSKKQSLKRWEFELEAGKHKEVAYPWDEPLPENAWAEVAEYCANDVRMTKEVFKARIADFKARLILSELSGLSPNATTRMHATKIIFGNERKPKLEYTDLSEMFPGYEYKDGHSMYMGEDPKEGGYVYAEPGVYFNVALLDIASMHPTSIEQLNLFGEYTKRFSEIKQARIFIKHKDYESAKKLLDGKLTPYLTDEKEAKDLSQALKIVINSIYGYTSAKFDNPFRDPRNIDNIVAKRGALFMINLKHEVQARGFTVAHIKTDSIKIPNATPAIIEFVMDYGVQYGYIFEHEDTYEKMCLVNDAVYIAKSVDGHWSAVGTQFQVPYVYKTLFSKEDIKFEDVCEIKSVTTSMYVDYNEGLEEGEHNYVFVGKVGQYTPVLPGKGGGILLRKGNDDKYSSVVGTKGYRWKESANIYGRMDEVDISYYRKMVDEASDLIDSYAKQAGITVDEFII